MHQSKGTQLKQGLDIFPLEYIHQETEQVEKK
jgi:hypothetical protein